MTLQDIGPALHAKHGSTSLQVAQRRLDDKFEGIVEQLEKLLNGIRK